MALIVMGDPHKPSSYTIHIPPKYIQSASDRTTSLFCQLISYPSHTLAALWITYLVLFLRGIILLKTSDCLSQDLQSKCCHGSLRSVSVITLMSNVLSYEAQRNTKTPHKGLLLSEILWYHAYTYQIRASVLLLSLWDIRLHGCLYVSLSVDLNT